MNHAHSATSVLKRSRVILGVALILGVLARPESLVAQTAPPPTTGPGGAKPTDNPTGWTAKAGLSYVATGGNAEASTLGLKLGASYNWTRTFFTLQGSAVHSGTTFKDSFAVGPTDADFLVVDNERTETTAANYFLDANLDRLITKRLYWQAGAGWLRNTFAGVEGREAFRGGVGYIWTDPDSKGVQFRTALLATLTHQSETIPDPGADETFVGARFLADLTVPFGGKSVFSSRASLDENLQSTDDFRMTWWNSLGVTMTDRLGIQVSLLLYFDNLPALQEINRYASESGGLPVGPPIGSALVPLKKWDRELAVSLVLNLVPKKPAPPPAPTGAR
jgi:hypothetical protein